MKSLSLVNWLSQHGAATLDFVATFLSHLAQHLLKRASAVVALDFWLVCVLASL